jgi:hypothetical protein
MNMLKIEIALAIATLSSVVFSVTFTSRTIPREWMLWGRVFAAIGLIVSVPGLIEAVRYFISYLPDLEMAGQLKHSGLIAYMKSVHNHKDVTLALLLLGVTLYCACVFAGTFVEGWLNEMGYERSTSNCAFSILYWLGLALRFACYDLSSFHMTLKVGLY